jgi:tetratricopeptide (TPR) repeat protein
MGTDAGVDLTRAATMIELGRYDEAAGLLAVIVAAAPDTARAWSLLSRAHLGAGRGAEAVLAARRAGALNPADDWPYRLASTALVSLGRGGEAVGAALEARKLAPGFWRSHVCLAQAATAAGDRPLAVQAVTSALAIAPGEPDVQFTAGKVALSNGDLARARSHQQAALAVDPGHSGAINELGRISLRERDVGAAASFFLRAARAAPGVGIFGRNTEVALAKVLTSIVVPVALLLAITVDLLILVAPLGRPLELVAAIVVLVALTCGYAAFQVRRLPPEGRRHLGRMLRRREWLLTVGGIVGIVVGLAAFAAIMVRAAQSGRSTLVPGLVVLMAGVAARLLVTVIIRRSRRNIR